MSLYKDFYFQLNVLDIKDIILCEVVQNDVKSNRFNVRLYQDTEIMDLSSAVYCTFTIVKPDNNQVVSNVEIADPEGGLVRGVLPTGAINISGEYKLTIEAYDGIGRLTKAVMYYEVVAETNADDGIVSSNEYPVLTQLINDVIDVNQNENERQTNEIVRQSNEVIRQQQEQDRQNSMATIEEEWNNLTTGQQQDAEVILARTSTIYGETFANLGDRLSKTEEEIIKPDTIPLDTNYSPITSIPNGSKGLFSPEAFGNTDVNLLGSRGSFEDVGDAIPWYNSTLSVSGGIMTATATENNCGIAYDITSQVQINKKYFMFADIESDISIIEMLFRTTSASQDVLEGNYNITNVASFQSIGVKVQSISDAIDQAYVYIRAAGTNIGDTIKVKKWCLLEITADEYNNLTEQQLLEKYHYIDGIQSTTSFDIMARTNNIFNKYNVGVSNYAIVNYLNNGVRIKSTSDGAWRNAKFKVRVKRNCDYYFKADSNVMSGASFITIEGENEEVLGYAGAFNTKDNDTITVLLFCTKETVTNGEVEYTNIQLTEGTTAPTEYIPYEESIAEVRLPEEYPLAKLDDNKFNYVDKDGNLHTKLEQKIDVHQKKGWVLGSIDTNTIRFSLPSYLSGGTLSTEKKAILQIGSAIFYFDNNIANIDKECIAYHENDLYIRINRSRLTVSEDVAGFESWLQTQGSSKLIYELADDHKRIIPNGHEGFSFPPSIQTWENGDLVVIPKKEVVLDGSLKWMIQQNLADHTIVKITNYIKDNGGISAYGADPPTGKLSKVNQEIQWGTTSDIGKFNFADGNFVYALSWEEAGWSTTPSVQNVEDYFKVNPHLLKIEVDPAYFTYPKITGNIPANLGTAVSHNTNAISKTNAKMTTLEDKVDLLIVLNS